VIFAVLGCRPSAPVDVQEREVRAGPPADAIATPSGLRYRIVVRGAGAAVGVADEVLVRYRVVNGRGDVVAQSDAEPESLQMTALPAGWVEGMQLIRKGGHAELWLPAKLGYGEGEGVTHGDLFIDVELVDVVRAPQWANVVLPFDAPPPGATWTPTGLAYVVIRKGTGTEHPRSGMKIKAHYSGWHTDGKLFDSSYERNEPITFRTDQVIAGWTEALALMVVGEKSRFWIPEALAYKGQPGRPAGMLVFDIELLAIEP
jgi:FKBP-type peptidyl-prolyl cis-trans isomerase